MKSQNKIIGALGRIRTADHLVRSQPHPLRQNSPAFTTAYFSITYACVEPLGLYYAPAYSTAIGKFLISFHGAPGCQSSNFDRMLSGRFLTLATCIPKVLIGMMGWLDSACGSIRPDFGPMSAPVASTAVTHCLP